MTLPIMTHAVKLDMPQANNPPPPVRPEVIELEVDFDGTIVWNGTVVSGIDTLESYFRIESTKDPQPEIHLRPDRRVKYDHVAKLLAAAQRNHMKKIGFVNTAEFRE
jgi:biopolymer transport protein ExbD